jgi:branched-subunit amino acid aminotransferase/4-amino-4-deoxychorismate lyase
MAGFEGVKWASKQLQYLLNNKQINILEAGAKVYAVNRSIHYGQFLAFEGIRFFCRKDGRNQIELVFLNWEHNLERFRKGMAFNLSAAQQKVIPAAEELEHLFIHQYFKHPSMREFLEEMAETKAQGYLRPFTVDEEESIGVTFPGEPSIRAVACRYDRYLGEPFYGVVVPHLVRAVSINQTGCLKLGVNYLISVKAIDEARKIDPEAASAMFLDDQPHKDLESRLVTEWDSSCCLFALRDGTVVKIPENPLILPSVTIGGIVEILREMNVPVLEKEVSYGEMIQWDKDNQLVAVCSVGTAGIMNRCYRLRMVDQEGQTIQVHNPIEDHMLFRKLADAKKVYWNIYTGEARLPAGAKLSRYKL